MRFDGVIDAIGQTPLVRGLVIGILGAFAAGGAVIGTSKTYAASLGGGDATYGLLFGAVFVGLGLGMPAGDLRKPLTGLEGDALAKGVHIVQELGLDKVYGYKVKPITAVAA